MNQENAPKQRIHYQTEKKGPFSGDQALFSQWDQIPKLAGYIRTTVDRDPHIIHMFHLIDALGRNNFPKEDDVGPTVTNEYFGYRDGKEIQPSWFAVSDAMSFPTMESMLPRQIMEFVGEKERLDTFTHRVIATIADIDPDERDKVKQTLKLLGYQIPNSADDVSKQLTESNWYGIVDTSGRSASSYNFAEIESAERSLMVKQYSQINRTLPPEDRPAMRRRFEELVGKNGLLYKKIRNKSLPDVAEEIYKILTEEVTRITGVNFNDVDVSETTQYAQLPRSEKELRGDENERFKFFNWYAQHRELYDNAHNAVSERLSRKKENPIQPLSITKGETPFWVVAAGQRSKLYYNSEFVAFADKRIPLEKPMEDWQDLKSVLCQNFPDMQFSVSPTAIGLLLQMRANGDVLLPEKGSSYVEQANMTWKEIVKNAKGPDLWDLMQHNIIRVHPHGMSAIPDGKRLKLPWYIQEGFTKDEEGYTPTEDFKREWNPVVESRRETLHQASNKQTIAEKAEVLYATTGIPHIHGLIQEYKTNSQTEAAAKGARGILNAEILDVVNKDVVNKKDPSKVMRDVSQYLLGKIEVLPDTHPLFSQFSDKLKTLRAQQEQVNEHSARQDKIDTLLKYYVALRYRVLEGGAEALGYFDARPSAMTMYTMFGEEAIANLIKNAQIRVEVTDKEPIEKKERIDAEGNKLLVVEDKLGWATRDPIKGGEMIQRAAIQLQKDNLDTAILLTRPTDQESHYQMVIVEKDGSISSMCGNGILAAAYFMKENYGKDKIKLQSSSGEVVTGFTDDAEHEFGARLRNVAILGESKPDKFAGLISDTVRMNINPMKEVRRLAQQNGIDLDIVTLRQILEEPHIIARLPQKMGEDELRTIAAQLMHLVDEKGEEVFPAGININFVGGPINNPTLYTYERGVGNLTGSCGTGSICAASLVMENTNMRDITFTTWRGLPHVQCNGQDYVLRGKAKRIE